jgi:glycosyltransferase involved in cell wall biosynthesis
MLKILVVQATVFGLDGISRVVTNYYLYQNHNEIKMDILTINPVNEKLAQEMRINGDYNYVIPFRNKKPIKYIESIAEIIKKNGYQLIHVHGCSATLFVEMLAAKLAGVQVRIAHSHSTACDHVKINNILKPFFLRLCTDGFACGLEAGKWLFNGRIFKIIPNGIDMQTFRYNESIREEVRKRYGLENNLVVGHVGRFSEQKNHRKLIEIFEAFYQKRKDGKLVLVGDGVLKKEIEEIARKKNLDVLFVGLSNEVEKWFQTMDIVVFPSLYEGLPLGIIEAQATGLPCLLSNTISPLTAITDLVQFIDLNANTDIWVQKILDIDITKRKTHQVLVEQQIKKAHFDIRENCKELENIYKMMIEKPKKAAQ